VKGLSRQGAQESPTIILLFSGPIVIANGERDTPNREGESRFLEQFPNADRVVITDAGHACALQQPQRFAQVVERLMAVTT